MLAGQIMLSANPADDVKLDTVSPAESSYRTVLRLIEPTDFHPLRI